MSATGPAAGLRVGPLAFQPGVTGANVTAVLYAAFVNVALLSYLPFIQPFLLTEVLGIPAGEQGGITGNLVLLQEIVVLSLMGFSGAASDRFGRRAVFVAGFSVLAGGFLFYPLAGDVADLYGARVLFAAGVAIVPVMVTACVVDVIREDSRGRWVGAISVMSALGAVFMATVLSKLPEAFRAAGLAARAAAEYAHWIAALLSLLTAAVLYAGLRNYRAQHRRATGQSTVRGIVAAGRAAIANPRLGLAFGGAFIGRGDFAVIGTFFSLWIVQAGVARGMASSEALVHAGRLFGLVQITALTWGVVMGFLCDRLDRTLALALAAGLAAVGYGALGVIGDPFAPGMLGVAVLAGIGEVSVVVAAGALLGQQAPAEIRGAVSGVYGVLGALGIGLVSAVGGQLFDSVAWSGPFYLMLVLNLFLLAAAVVIRAGERG